MYITDIYNSTYMQEIGRNCLPTTPTSFTSLAYQIRKLKHLYKLPRGGDPDSEPLFHSGSYPKKKLRCKKNKIGRGRA